MVKVTPCSPTIGKVRQILKEVFRLPRILGTCPINPEFSGISKSNLVKGLIIYVFAALYATQLLCWLWESNEALSNKITFSIQIFLQVMFHLINLPCLVTNRSLFSELNDDLKDIEYNLWSNGISWFYKPNWHVKYFSFFLSIIYLIIWDVYHDFFEFIVFNIVHYMTIPSIYSIMNQYLALLQICLSLLRGIRLLEDTRTSVQLTEKVLSLCQKVNTLHEQQFLLYIVGTFFISLFTIYTKLIHSNFFEDDAVWHILRLFLVMHPLLLIIRCMGYITEEVLMLYYKYIIFTI